MQFFSSLDFRSSLDVFLWLNDVFNQIRKGKSERKYGERRREIGFENDQKLETSEKQQIQFHFISYFCNNVFTPIASNDKKISREIGKERKKTFAMHSNHMKYERC